MKKTINYIQNIKESSISYRVQLSKNRVMSLNALQAKDISIDSEYVKLLTKWRNIHYKWFFSWVKVTHESTYGWLKQYYVPSPSDIIFFIEDKKYNKFGCMAVYNISANSCEVGRFMKGDSNAPKGGMTVALNSMLNWIYNNLKVDTVYLEVFESNIQAIKLYQRCGFVIKKRIPLEVIENDNTKSFQPIQDAQDSELTAHAFALQMEHKQQDSTIDSSHQ